MADLDQIENAAQLLKALGDPTRLRMLGLLQQGELCVCDIMAVLDLPQSTASRHLAYLRNTGWISGRRENKWMYYTLIDDTVDTSLQQTLLHFIARNQPQEDMAALTSHLQQKKSTSCLE